MSHRAVGLSANLWFVRMPERRRVHLVAQIASSGRQTWTADSTVCGLAGYENYVGPMRQVCQRCWRHSGIDPWKDAPVELLTELRLGVPEGFE